MYFNTIIKNKVSSTKFKVTFFSDEKMTAKLGVFLIFAIFCFQKIDSFCVIRLIGAEKECADPMNLNAYDILKLYDADSEDPQFVQYLNCVWLKWNYTDESGAILWKNLELSTNLPWHMARKCEDTYYFIVQQMEDFHKAAKFCSNNRPSVETPLTVRRCIVNNYKPTPITHHSMVEKTAWLTELD